MSNAEPEPKDVAGQPTLRPPVRMHADTPLDDESDDTLDRRHFAAGVAQALTGRSDRSSIVVGVYGPWGDGKTSVLHWIRKRLESPQAEMIVVPFNPWLVRDELTLLPTFFSTLATALGRQMGGRTQQIASVLQRYSKVLSGLSVGVPGASFDPGATGEAIGQAMADRTLDDMKREFEAILREEKKRVLVIIDDVDRLDDAEIHAVFKLVKLAAAFEGINYLLAFDDDKVAAALAKRYSSRTRGSNEHQGGFDFLEKIVQVPLHLPKARRSALNAIALAGLQAALDDAEIEVSERDEREFRLRYSLGLAPAITSVRTAKRYANAAGFALPLLKGETHPVDVLSIEGINACYPALYSAIREHPDWFLLPYEFHLSHQVEERRVQQRARLEGVLESVEPSLREPAKELLQRVFPQTDQLWSAMGAADEHEEWAEQQRVSSAEYFDRYFSYGIAATEISDHELDGVFGHPGGLTEPLRGLMDRLSDGGLKPLLEKIARRAPGLDDGQSAALIAALIAIGPRVARDRQRQFVTLNTEQTTARLLAELVLQFAEPADRARLARQIAETGEPASFAAECLYWLRLKKSHTDDRRPIDDAQLQDVQVRFATRVSRYAHQLDHPIWLDDGGLGLMYRARDGGQGKAMRRHVANWLKREPHQVASLLRAAAGISYGGDLGLPTQQDLTTDMYEGLGEVAVLENIRTAVDFLRGGARPPTEFPSVRYDQYPDDVMDERILAQFAWQDARGTQVAGPVASSAVDPNGVTPPATPAHEHGSARGLRASTRSSPTLHAEIAAILEEAGESLSPNEIAARVNSRRRYLPLRRTTPMDAAQIRARVRRPEYRERFIVENGRIGLRNS